MKKIALYVLLIFCPFLIYAQECNIRKEVDKYEDQTTFRTEYNGFIGGIKYLENGKVTYYLSLRCKGSTVSVNVKGVKVLLQNKQVLNFPNAEVDIEVDDEGGYEYSAFIPLNESQAKLLSIFEITDFRLYIYDWIYREDVSFDFLWNMKCLIKAE